MGFGEFELGGDADGGGEFLEASKFTRGLVASLWVGVAVLVLALVSSLLIPQPEDSVSA